MPPHDRCRLRAPNSKETVVIATTVSFMLLTVTRANAMHMLGNRTAIGSRP